MFRRFFQADYWTSFALGRFTLPTVVVAVLLTAGAVVLAVSDRRSSAVVATVPPHKQNIEASSQAKGARMYSPTAEQWAMLTVEPVAARAFRTELLTEGKIAINDDLATPVFSPYAGRVTRVVAKAGDAVTAGQPLFFIEATEMVQAQNDFLSRCRWRQQGEFARGIDRNPRQAEPPLAGDQGHVTARLRRFPKPISRRRVANYALRRPRWRRRATGSAFSARLTTRLPASSRRGYQPGDADLSLRSRARSCSASSDRASTSATPARARSIRCSPSAISSTVWVVAYVRESEAPKVRVGQQIEFSVMAYPDQAFQATMTMSPPRSTPGRAACWFAPPSITRRCLFKPEMFASVTIYTSDAKATVAVPRDAVIFEAGHARVWVVKADRSIEERQVKTGLVSGALIEVVDGLRRVTKSSPRAASSSTGLPAAETRWPRISRPRPSCSRHSNNRESHSLVLASRTWARPVWGSSRERNYCIFDPAARAGARAVRHDIHRRPHGFPASSTSRRIPIRRRRWWT